MSKEPDLFEEISSEVRVLTGVDFGCFRPATVRRRISNRMVAVGADSADAYLDLLRGSEREAAQLLERVTIKVSGLYRNPGVFDRLRRDVLPELAASAERPLRVWSAGCAHGEEAFTLAMLLEEAGIGGEVLATDVDREALAIARQGVVEATALVQLPRDLKGRFVQRRSDGGGRIVRPVLRRVRFAALDLTRPLPRAMTGRFALVCCRNVLIYFRREVQRRVELGLRAALAPGGFLCFGEAEWPCAELLSTLSVAHRGARLFRSAGGDERAAARA